MKLKHVLMHPEQDGGTGGGGDSTTQPNELSNVSSTVNSTTTVQSSTAAESTSAASADKDHSGINRRFQQVTSERDAALRAAADANERHRLAAEALAKVTGQSAAATQKKADEEDPQPMQPELTGNIDADQTAMVEYAGKLAGWTARREAKTILAQEQQRRVQETAAEGHRKIQQDFQTRREAALSEYPDYVAVAEDPTLPITEHMAGAIMAHQDGPHIAVFLGRNRAEAERISKLPSGQQLVEMGMLIARVQGERASRKVTNAQPPINTVGAGATTTKSLTEVGNEQSPAAMDEYAKRRQDQIAAERKPGVRR